MSTKKTMTEYAKDIQQVLRDAGVYSGDIDGKLWGKSQAGLNTVRRMADAELKAGKKPGIVSVPWVGGLQPLPGDAVAVENGVAKSVQVKDSIEIPDLGPGFAWLGRGWEYAPSLFDALKSIKPVLNGGVCFHHTGAPSLAHRPFGQRLETMINMARYWKNPGENKKAWKAGAHFVVDDNRIWGVTPPNMRGVHAASFNQDYIGIEVLGNYDVEDPLTGRGLACWTKAFYAAAVILQWQGLKPSASTIKFHRQDRKTTKSCPGTKVDYFWVVNEVQLATDSIGRL